MPNQRSGSEAYIDLLNDLENFDTPRLDPDDFDEIYQLEKDHAQVSTEQAHLRQLLQNIDERKKYANRIFWLVCGWLSFVGAIVLGAGIQGHLLGCTVFHLPESVLIALITTTTINVIGIFLFVMRYLFSDDKNK